MALALNAEQLRAYIRELDEEYRRNRVAAETLLRAIERNESSAPRPVSEPGDKVPMVINIERLVAANPEHQWDVQSVINALAKQGIQPTSTDINKTVGNALGKLYRQRKLELVSKGSGSRPSVYRWKLGAAVSESGGSLDTFWSKQPQ